jgi:hypothetical protein
MNLKDKIKWNENSSKEFGWKPEWFGSNQINESFIQNVINFQKELGLVADGLVGEATHRLIKTWVQSNATEYIICSGKRVKIDWPKVITMMEPGAIVSSPKSYKKSPGRIPKMFIVHWDACLSSASCGKVLEERGLSVHFCIDNDGTIYQLLDAEDIAYHAKSANPISVGVEMSNAFYTKYQDTYIKKGFGPRPVLKNTKIHDSSIKEHLMFYPEQERALSALVRAVCGAYDIPLAVPLTNGSYATGEHPEVASGRFRGVACHFHLTKEKIDCAGLDLEKIIK